MRKNIAILGSTGSIGTSALDLFGGPLKDSRVIALSANGNSRLLLKQIRKFRPKYAAIASPAAAAQLRKKAPGVKVLSGIDGLCRLASLKEADTVLLSVVGAIGIVPLLSAVRAKKRVALANKEALVTAGDIVMREAKKYGASIMPVDSEHNAIFQALQGNDIERVKRLIITASGGPFKNARLSELKNITVERALDHPTWKMGKKITIDSATLMNKGLEIIEAHHLFGIPYEKIGVLIHPQSIVHSMVEYVDGSVIAQLSVPDMRLAIQYALTYPERLPGRVKELDLADVKKLYFGPVDFKRFPAFALALKAGKEGGTMPAFMNAANEEAVKGFLSGRVKFLNIAALVKRAMKAHRAIKKPTIEDILRADLRAREFVRGEING